MNVAMTRPRWVSAVKLNHMKCFWDSNLQRANPESLKISHSKMGVVVLATTASSTFLVHYQISGEELSC